MKNPHPLLFLIFILATALLIPRAACQPVRHTSSQRSSKPNKARRDNTQRKERGNNSSDRRSGIGDDDRTGAYGAKSPPPKQPNQSRRQDHNHRRSRDGGPSWQWHGTNSRQTRSGWGSDDERYRTNDRFDSNRREPFWNEKETSVAISKILRRTKPRGLIHGIWKASQSTTLGFVVGMTCLITFPSTSLLLVGPQWRAMLLSAALGSVMGLAAVSLGIWNGMYHCYWGLVQTPKSIQSLWKKSVWNPYDGGSWQRYDLVEHQRELLREQEAWTGTSKNHYQVLEVPMSATKSAIKRAYYLKAKELHPDKNPSDPEQAEEDFLQLQAAYRTLSDDAQRSLYDELGHSPSSSSQDALASMFHPNILFSILFDSKSLQPFLGNLAVSSWALKLIQLGLFANAPENDPQESVQKLILMVADLQRKEQKRQVDVALHLLESMDLSNGDLAFRQWCRQQATAMVERSFFRDTRLLGLVGERLELNGRKWEGRPFGLIRGGWLWTKSSAGMLSHRLEFYKGLFGLLKFLLRYMDALRRGDFSFLEGGEDPKKEEAMKLIAPKLLHLLWHHTALDVQATIDGASWKVLSDANASRSERSMRAKALRIMGQEFAKVVGEGRSEVTMIMDDQEQSAPEVEKDDENGSFAFAMDPMVRLEVAMAVARDQAIGEDNPTMLRKRVHEYLEQREKRTAK